MAAHSRLSDLKPSLQTVVHEEDAAAGTRSWRMPFEGVDPFTSLASRVSTIMHCTPTAVQVPPRETVLRAEHELRLE